MDAGPLTAKEASTQQTQGSDFWTLRYEGVLTPNLILNAQAAYYAAPLDAVPQSGDFTTKGWVDYFTGRISRNAINAQYSDRYRNQADVTLTWNKQGWAGDHTFKAGVDAAGPQVQLGVAHAGRRVRRCLLPAPVPGPRHDPLLQRRPAGRRGDRTRGTSGATSCRTSGGFTRS